MELLTIVIMDADESKCLLGLGRTVHFRYGLAENVELDCLAEWSKALASGASPKGRGFESLSSHFFACLMPCGSNDRKVQVMVT